MLSEKLGLFLSILIPFLFFCTQMSWWNWATLRLRLPRGNPRVSRSFSSQELLAGLPAGAQGWPPARAAMPTLLRARLALPVLAQIQVVLGVDVALVWLESVGWVTHSIPGSPRALQDNALPGQLHFGPSPCPSLLHTQCLHTQ